MFFLLVGVALAALLTLQQRPAGVDHHQSSSDLHHWNRNPEERQDLAADQHRSRQQPETVERDFHGQDDCALRWNSRASG